MSLTDSLRYTLKGSAVSSRAYKHKVTPTNGSSFTLGQLARLDIPSGMRNTYLDPSQTWLEFTFTLTIATGGGPDSLYKFDGSANTLIKKIEIYSSAGSNLLESIDNYPTLFQACANVVGDLDDMTGIGSVAAGFYPPLSGTDVLATTSNASWLGRSQRFRDLGSMLMASAQAYTFQLPLVCMIGTLGEKYIPLHALAADLRMEITFNTTACLLSPNPLDSPLLNATTTTTALGLSTNINGGVVNNALVAQSTTAGATTVISALTSNAITNIFLHCTMVQVSDDAQAAIDAMTGGIYTFHGSSWRNFQNTLATSSTATSFLIPARYSSLKQLLITHRGSAAATGNYVNRGFSSFCTAGMTSYQFRIGSVLMPQAKVNPFATDGRNTEALMELLRSFHALGMNTTGSPINVGSWTLTTPDTSTTVTSAKQMQGTFCVGLELESFANKNDVIMSGVSTLGQNIFFEASYSATALTGGYLIDAFACYDVLYTLQDGVLTAQF